MASLLETIHSPKDIKELGSQELNALCEEIRRVIIDTVSANGGHLASNLGVVELTVALGLAFSPPRDTIVGCGPPKLSLQAADRTVSSVFHYPNRGWPGRIPLPRGKRI